MGDELVVVRGLKKYYPIYGGIFLRKVAEVKAVDGVDLVIRRGETLGLVGESGCGKTTLGRTILRLIEPTAGEVLFEGIDIFKLKSRELRKLRREMQVIFQDPFSSLNPRLRVIDIIGEALEVHGIAEGSEKKALVADLLKRVGLSPEHIYRYPHEFSGGQRQRIAIARALALKPKFIVADEPVSSLDVSIRSQILNLMKDLQEEYGLTYLFISHDLSVVKYMSDEIAVMYLGKIVEHGESREILRNPLHPYTKALISAVPVPDPLAKRERIVLKGDVPSPLNPPSGCRFRTRCPYAKEICAEEEPPMVEAEAGHFVACHLFGRK